MQQKRIFVLRFWICIALLICLDQATKLFLISYLKTLPGYMKSVNAYFDLVFAWNYGISFGIFSEYYQYSNYIFVFLNTILCCALYLNFIKNRFFMGSFIVAGGISNLIDRANHGAVFDFISLHYSSYYFAVFNLADAFISIGALFFIMFNFAKSK